jgi:hypothetical protein
VRGAKSIREIITKHRESATCFGCHQKIDPPGFALENFDPIGAWRTRYRLGKKQGPEIDPSGELPTGEAFKDIVDFKKLLLQRKTLFARMLTERLLTYATGRRMEALDRPEVNRIVSDLCGSPAAAFPSQPCWRSVLEAGILKPNSFANAVAVRCWQRQACVPAAGLPPESGRRPAAVQGACGSGGGAPSTLDCGSPAAAFPSQPCWRSVLRDWHPTKQLRQRGSGSVLASAKPVSRQQGCLQKAAGGLPQSKEPAAREAVL